MAVIKDIIEGALSRDKDGFRHTRVFIVTDLTGTPSQRLYKALTTPGVPQFGDGHPSIPGIFALNIQSEPEAKQNTLARVVVDYESPSFDNQSPSEGGTEQEPTIQVGSNVTTAKTQKNKDGNQLFVSLVTSAGVNRDQVGEVDIQIPQSVVQFQRRESGTPLTKSIEYTGAVNSLSVGQTRFFAERTLLCTAIEGQSDDNGRTFTVTYQFQYEPNTWDATLVFQDTETDRAHPDVNLANSNGIKVERVYRERDFRKLNLNF